MDIFMKIIETKNKRFYHIGKFVSAKKFWGLFYEYRKNYKVKTKSYQNEKGNTITSIYWEHYTEKEKADLGGLLLRIKDLTI